MSWLYQPLLPASLLGGITPATGSVSQSLGFSQSVTGLTEGLGEASQSLGFSQTVAGTVLIEGLANQSLGFSQTVTGLAGSISCEVDQDLGFSQTVTAVTAVAGAVSQDLGFSQTVTCFAGGVSGTVSHALAFSQTFVGIRSALVTIPDTITTTSSFFDTKFAEAIYKGFKGKLLKGYYRSANVSGVDGMGDRAITYTVYTCEGIVSEYSAFFKKANGIPESDIQILVITNSLSVTPTKADQIKFRSQWYQVRKIDKDPANATWTLQAFRIADPT